MYLIQILFIITSLYSQDSFCEIEQQQNTRSIYSIGDTLSIEDQNLLFPVCNGSGDYSTGDTFSFSDQIGKITLISMNATWWPACYDYISLMDEIIEVLEEYEDVQFLVSLDYSSNEADLYSCYEWGNLYT